MPRMPKNSQDSYIIINNSSNDVQLKILEEKLKAEIEKKQNGLQAGNGISIAAGQGTDGKDIISYNGTQPEPTPTPTSGVYILTYIGESPLEGEE